MLSFLLTATFSSEAHALDYQYQIAAQNNWAMNLGFYLVMENNYNGNERCSLNDMELILGVADGKGWRYLRKKSAWEYDRDYSIKAIISYESAELWLDGEMVESSSGGFSPIDIPLSVNQIVGWANPPTDYLILPGAIEVTGADTLRYNFVRFNERPLPLLLFEPNTPEIVKWKSSTEHPLTIDASLRFAPFPDVRVLSPFIDRYGQSIHADWPEKVKSDEELREDIEFENAQLKEMPPPETFDKYGGLLDNDLEEKGTGFFRVARKDGYWWLITPDGNPCFYLGVCFNNFSNDGIIHFVAAQTGQTGLSNRFFISSCSPCFFRQKHDIVFIT